MAMKDEAGRKMLSCKEAAEEYGCTMRYIRKLAKDGKISSEVVGGSYMVAADEVRKLARKHPNVRVVPWGSEARSSGVRFVDGLHYRAVDYRLMAKFIADELNSLLPAADPPAPGVVAPPIA